MAEACINTFIDLWEILVSTGKTEEQRKEEESKSGDNMLAFSQRLLLWNSTCCPSE